MNFKYPWGEKKKTHWMDEFNYGTYEVKNAFLKGHYMTYYNEQLFWQSMWNFKNKLPIILHVVMTKYSYYSEKVFFRAPTNENF